MKKLVAALHEKIEENEDLNFPMSTFNQTAEKEEQPKPQMFALEAPLVTHLGTRQTNA